MNVRAVHPLTSPQMGVWLEQRLVADRAFHNIGEFLRIRGPLETPLFSAALQLVVDRTASLRTRISLEGDLPVEEVVSGMACDLEVVDFRQVADPMVAAREWMAADMRQPFALEEGPLFRFALLRVGQEDTLWYSKYHHIFMDGAGVAIVAQRVAETYTALMQGTEPEWAADLAWDEVVQDDRAYATSPQQESDRGFWLAHCRDLPPPASLSARVATVPDPGPALVCPNRFSSGCASWPRPSLRIAAA